MSTTVVGRATIIIDGDSRPFDQKVTKAAKDTGGRLSSILGGAAKYGSVALGALAVSGAAVGVKTAASMEQAKIAFTTMLGSGAKADAFLKQLAAFAAKTPFEFPELQTAASSLISAGVEANRVIPIMTSLGNATSGMGTGSEGVKRATVALQQMNAAGKITGEDLNQLRDAGIPVYDLLAKATGKSKAEVSALAAAGKLGKKELDQMMKALESGAGLERFSGLMDKQSTSLAGLWSTLHDTITMGLAKMIEPLLPTLKNLINFTSDFASKALPWLSQSLVNVGTAIAGFVQSSTVKEWAARIVDGVKVLASVIGSTVLPALAAMGRAVLAVVQFFAEHKAAAIALGIVVGSVLSTIAAAWVAQGVVATINAAKSVAAWVSTAFAANTSATIQSKTTAQIVAGWVLHAATATWAGIKIAAAWLVAMGPIGWAITAVVAIGAALVVLWNKSETFRQIVTGAWEAVKGAVAGVLDWFTNTLWPGIQAVWDGIVSGVSAVGSAISGAFSTVMEFLSTVGTFLIEWGLKVLDWLTIPFRVAIGLILTILGAAWDLLKVPVEAIGEMIVTAFTAIWDTAVTIFTNVKDWLVEVWTGISDWLGEAWTAISTAASDVFNAIATTLSGVWTTISTAISTAWNAISTWFADKWAAISKIFTDALAAISSGISTVFTTIKTTISTVWEAIKSLLKAGWDWISTYVFAPIKAGVGYVGGVFTNLWKDTIKPAWDTVQSGLEAGWKWIRDNVFGPIKSAVAAVGTAFQNAKDAIGRVWNGLKDALSGPVQSALKWIQQNLIDRFNGLMTKLGVGLQIPAIWTAPRVAPGGRMGGSWAAGGWTGGGDPRKAAGIVHGREWVLNAKSTAALIRDYGSGFLEALNGYAAGGWVSPVIGYKPAFPWGHYPSGGVHKAYDYAVPTGTNVYAPDDGTVARAGWDSTGYGNAVFLNHNNGLFSVLGHLQTILVSAGRFVAAGQRVGKSDNTGRSTGPHLHWGVMSGGIYGPGVNPGSVSTAGGVDFGKLTADLLRNGIKAIGGGLDWLGEHLGPIGSLVGGIGKKLLDAVGGKALEMLGFGEQGGGRGVSFDRGGWLQPGWNPPSYNGTGRPEPVGFGTSGPVTVYMTVSVDDLAKMSKMGDFLTMLDRQRVDARRTERSGAVSA